MSDPVPGPGPAKEPDEEFAWPPRKPLELLWLDKSSQPPDLAEPPANVPGDTSRPIPQDAPGLTVGATGSPPNADPIGIPGASAKAPAPGAARPTATDRAAAVRRWTGVALLVLGFGVAFGGSFIIGRAIGRLTGETPVAPVSHVASAAPPPAKEPSTPSTPAAAPVPPPAPGPQISAEHRRATPPRTAAARVKRPSKAELRAQRRLAARNAARAAAAKKRDHLGRTPPSLLVSAQAAAQGQRRVLRNASPERTSQQPSAVVKPVAAGKAPAPAVAHETPPPAAAPSSPSPASMPVASREPATSSTATHHVEDAPRRTSSGDEQRIRAVLENYQAGYEQFDSDAVKAVWPTVDARALDRAFSGLSEQSIVFDRCDVTVAGGSARAACLGSVEYVMRVGSRAPHTARQQWTFNLRKTDDGSWLIHSVNKE